MSRTTSVEVFQKIKELSRRTANANHRILVSEIGASLNLSQDSLLVLLTELENRGLIRLYKTMVFSVSLTNYGMSQNDPPPGIDSE